MNLSVIGTDDTLYYNAQCNNVKYTTPHECYYSFILLHCLMLLLLVSLLTPNGHRGTVHRGSVLYIAHLFSFCPAINQAVLEMLVRVLSRVIPCRCFSFFACDDIHSPLIQRLHPEVAAFPLPYLPVDILLHSSFFRTPMLYLLLTNMWKDGTGCNCGIQIRRIR